MTRVVVLRPEPGASETIDRAQALGLSGKSVPLFVVEPVEWQAPDAGGFDALLLTSANAVRLGGEQVKALRGLPVHAVGSATAEAAREAGFDIASSGDAGVERLLGSLEPELKLLHLCGENRTTQTGARQAIAAVPVYRSRAIEPGPAIDGAAGAIALVHSPRAGARLAELAEQQGLDRSSVTIAAISAAAEAATATGWKSVHHAAQSTDEALLALALRLCENRQG